MKTVTDSATLACTPETFWRTFLDPAYTRATYLDGLGFSRLDVLEQTETTRRLYCVPKLNLPGPLVKLVGESFAYEEHGTLDRARGLWTWRMVQPEGKGKGPTIATRGTTRVTAEGDAACRRSDEVVIEAKVFGLGGLIESTIEKEVRAGWDKENAFLRRWLSTHG